MRLVAGCIVAALVLATYDSFAHNGRYRTAAVTMAGHMTSVNWIR